MNKKKEDMKRAVYEPLKPGWLVPKTHTDRIPPGNLKFYIAMKGNSTHLQI